MEKFKYFRRIAGVICLALCLCVCFAACNRGDDTSTTTEPTTVGNSKYTVRVRTAGGVLLENVQLYVYTDATMEELETICQLDETGCATFAAAASDSYVAVLMGVPEGYDLQTHYLLSQGETEIVLTASVITDAEKPADKVYALGDVMYDFTVNASDGQAYTLSELLQEKEAVVLNFWYLNCDPCKVEFPYLEKAYREYGDRVEVLAINCEDGSDRELLNFRESYDLTFPLAIGEKDDWYKVAYNACPTTIVIDRYGVIVYMHTGYFSETAPFIALLRNVTGEDYQQKLIEDVNGLIIDSDYREDNTSERPFEHDGPTEFDVEVPGKNKVYYHLYNLSEMVMQVEHPNAYVVVGGQTYYPKNGVIKVNVHCPDAQTPVKVAFGNSGDKKITYRVQFYIEAGNINNPLPLQLGDNTVEITKLNATGVYYAYTAAGSGQLSLTVQQCTEGATPSIHLYNVNTAAAADSVYDSKTGTYTVSVAVKKGETVQIRISVATENTALKTATLRLLLAVKDGAGGVTDGKESYTVTVVDQDGNPIRDVVVQLTAGTSVLDLQTDGNGKATTRLVSGAYRLKLQVPAGYVADVTDFLWSPAVKSITIRLTATVSYSVQLQKYDGSVMAGVLARIYADEQLQELLYAVSTDETGTLHFTGKINTAHYIVFTNLGEDVVAEKYYVTAGQYTQIVLKDPTPPTPPVLQLGDQMPDFTVTAVDGTVYSLYDLLAQKDVVVLTFWKTDSVGSMVHMPVLQKAYEKYGTNAMVLALNPVDKLQDTLLQFQTQHGLTFPVAGCEQTLAYMLQVTEYPTTVVIDREGKICLIHAGGIVDETVYDTLFPFFTAEGYVHTTFVDLGALLNHAAPPTPDPENPDPDDENPGDGEGGGDAPGGDATP